MSPIGWSFVSGSGTPQWNQLVELADYNPSFSVIEFDKEFMVPINIFTYYMNLTKANENVGETPTWELLHDFKEEYGLQDLRPSNMELFTKKLSLDIETAA